MIRNKLLLLSILILCVTNIYSQYSVILSSPVNLRKGPSTETQIVASLMQNLVIVEDIGYTEETQKLTIWNKPYNSTWTSVKIGSLKAFIYSLFTEEFSTYEKAEEFVLQNNEMYAKMLGVKLLTREFLENYTNSYDNEGYQQHYLNSEFYYRFTFEEDGKFKIEIDGIEGDHFVIESGIGRYIVYSDRVLFRAGLNGTFAPEGYSWAEYYELDNGSKPTDKQLSKYKKEKGSYKLHFELIIPIEDFTSAFKDEEN